MEELNKMIEMLEKELCIQMEKGIENIDTDEYGKAVDIYKDLVYIKSLKKTMA